MWSTPLKICRSGGYRQALRFPPGEQITFDEDAFIHSRPPSMQPFLQKMLHLQIFEQFINDRLDRLIGGKGFSDEFDTEVNMEQDKWATQSRYKEWLGNMKVCVYVCVYLAEYNLVPILKDTRQSREMPYLERTQI